MFTEEEIGYLRSQPLARLATVAGDGQPDVVPVACEFDGTYFWVGGTDSSVINTRKFRRAGHLPAHHADPLVELEHEKRAGRRHLV